MQTIWLDMMAIFISFLPAHKKSIVLTSRCATAATFNHVFHLNVILFGKYAIVIMHYWKTEKDGRNRKFVSVFCPLHLITRPTPRIQKKCCMKRLHRHFVAYLHVILVKSGLAKYSFYMDLESDCVSFRHMRLIVQKLKHNMQWYPIQMCGFSKWCIYNEVHAKIFFVRCSNCGVIGFSTAYIHLFTCIIPLWYMNSSDGVQSVRHTVVLSLCTSSLIFIRSDSTTRSSTYRMNAFGKYIRPTPNLE